MTTLQDIGNIRSPGKENEDTSSRFSSSSSSPDGSSTTTSTIGTKEDFEFTMKENFLSVEEDLADIKKSVKKFTDLSSQVSQLSSQNRKLQESHDFQLSKFSKHFVTTNAMLQNLFQENAKREKENRHLRLENENLRTQVSLLDIENTKLRHDVAKLRQENAKLRQDNIILTKKVAHLEKKVKNTEVFLNSVAAIISLLVILCLGIIIEHLWIKNSY